MATHVATDTRATERLLELPQADLPTAPRGSVLWTRMLVVASIVLAAYLLDRLTVVLLDYWLFDSLGFNDAFSTNLTAGAVLFVVGLATVTLAIAGPAFVHGVSTALRRRLVWLGVLGGLWVGSWLAGEYLEFLGPSSPVTFGREDPVFGHDISFYVFDLPAIQIVLQIGLLLAVLTLVSSVATALVASRDATRPAGTPALVWNAARVATPVTLAALAALGVIAALSVWIGRYDLLLGENFLEAAPESGTGAQYLDVDGFFSTRNAITVEALAILALAIGVLLKLRVARRAVRSPGSVNVRRAFAPAALLLVALPGITTDLVFRAAVAIRDETVVTPNEPVIQIPYLQRHIDATNAAFGMDKIEERTFVPKGDGDPAPDLARLLRDPAVENAPLWPGFTSRYSRRVAPQYVQRILAAEGDMTIYGPTLEILQAQEKLRPYYDFLDVDTTVHTVDGTPKLLASTVRELPQDVPRPWLDAWGQRSFLFTHGYGHVSLPVSERTRTGDPVYGSRGIPTQGAPALNPPDQRLYYGEGASGPAFTNAEGIREHDRPTEQGRAEVTAPLDAGVEVDSLLKRIVVGWRGGNFVDVVFSDLVDDETRAHVFRRPLERIERIAPFLTLDTDPYAVPAQGGMTWMVNALTTSDRYPYSALVPLGEGSDLRTEERPLEDVNYAADSVKVTVDAATGQLRLYQIADEPVVRTWASIYPELFERGETMPADVRAQMQYPQALMSVQFNKIYPAYHQRDPVTFFSQEDILDDADEVAGPIRGESGTITFSQGLYSWLARPGGAMPSSSEPSQFALTKNYTPQDALNLRALATAYQLGDDYGRLSVLQVPKGRFFPGPEQADAAIDQDSFIAQQIGLWNRQGVEVIRGHTSLLIVDGEALYVEPIFIRSRQNPVPQLQRVIVVLRGQASMGRTMEEALRFAVEGGRLADLDDTPAATALPGAEAGEEAVAGAR